MPTLQQIAITLAQLAQDLLAYANTSQPVTYEGEYTATVTRSYTKQCEDGRSTAVDYTRSSTQKKNSNISVEEATKLAKVAAEAEALRLVEEGGQANANAIGKCLDSVIINPIPTVAFPNKPWIAKTEVVGLVGANILWKLTDTDGHSRSYLNIGNNFNSVGKNIYTNPEFKIKTGLSLEYILNGIVDIDTINNGLNPDPFAFVFSSNEATLPGTDNVIIEEPIVTPPSTFNRPLNFIYVWGFFWGKEPSKPIENATTHHAEQSAMSDPRFEHQKPWFAVDIPETEVDVYYKYDKTNSRWITDRRKVNTDWTGTQALMDEFISDMRIAKIDFLNFIYYADGYMGARMRNHYKTAVHKRGLNACYTIGQLGGDRANKNNPLDEYSINLAQIVKDLDAPWYQKKDGKPVVFFNPGSDSAKSYAEVLEDRNNLRAAYGKPMYEVFMNMNYNPDYSYLEYNGYNAKSWYYYVNDEVNGNHSIDSVIVDSEKVTRQDARNGKIIIPQVTALDQRARQHYPGDSVQWDRPGYTGHPNSYYFPNTKEQYFKQIDNFLQIAKEYPDKVPFIGLGIADENSETGERVFMKLKDANGNITKVMIDWSAEKFINY